MEILVNEGDMIIKMLLLAALSCPKTIVINKTDTWTKRDQKTMQITAQRCKQIYKDSPCLSAFIKKKELTYYAVCGKKK